MTNSQGGDVATTVAVDDTVAIDETDADYTISVSTDGLDGESESIELVSGGHVISSEWRDGEPVFACSECGSSWQTLIEVQTADECSC